MRLESAGNGVKLEDGPQAVREQDGMMEVAVACTCKLLVVDGSKGRVGCAVWVSVGIQ